MTSDVTVVTAHGGLFICDVLGERAWHAPGPQRAVRRSGTALQFANGTDGVIGEISGDVAYDRGRVFLAGYFGFFGSSASRTEPYIFCLRALRRAASLLKN